MTLRRYDTAACSLVAIDVSLCVSGCASVRLINPGIEAQSLFVLLFGIIRIIYFFD